MTTPPTSDDIKELTRAVNDVARALNVANQNTMQTAKLSSAIVEELSRIKNELHEKNRTKVRIFDNLTKKEIEQFTTGD